MPAVFPALATGVVGKYPITRGHRYRTQIYTSVDMSEQRFSKGVPLEEFNLVFTRVTTTDKETCRTFFNARKGAFDTTWTLTLTDTDGTPVTWVGLQFMPGQKFEATETHHGLWDFQLRVRQTRLS